MQILADQREIMIKNATLAELSSIFSSVIFEGNQDTIQKISKIVHRRLMDLSSDLKDPKITSLMISYFGYAGYKDENLWIFFEKILEKIHPVLDYENISDVLSGLSQADRTSGYIWDVLLCESKARISEASLDQKISVLKSITIAGVEDDFWVDNKAREILSLNSLENVNFFLKFF